MYETRLLEGIGTQAKETAVRACWLQWVAVGSMASPVGSRFAESMIDPEALILLSLCLVEEERRLGDLLLWWGDVGAGLTSVQRLRTVSDHFPEASGREAFHQFARIASDAGDRRWAEHAAPAVAWQFRAGKGPRALTLVRPGTLWLRLRAGFGVGAKSDTLAFLLGLRGARASVKAISIATGYSSVSVRKAVSEMALAGLVRETKGRPAEYSAPSRAWATMLRLQSAGEGLGGAAEAPRWRYWAELFAYLVHVIEWSRQHDSPLASGPRVQASRARDILERFKRPFAFNDIPVPDARAFQGAEAVTCLAKTTGILSDWVAHEL